MISHNPNTFSVTSVGFAINRLNRILAQEKDAVILVPLSISFFLLITTEQGEVNFSRHKILSLSCSTLYVPTDGCLVFHILGMFCNCKTYSFQEGSHFSALYTLFILSRPGLLAGLKCYLVGNGVK